MLLPLHPSLNGQLYAISREYGLPSIGGLSLYLCEDGDGNLGPRIGEASWQALWSQYFEESAEHSFGSPYSRSRTAENSYETGFASFDSHDSYPTDSQTRESVGRSGTPLARQDYSNGTGSFEASPRVGSGSRPSSRAPSRAVSSRMASSLPIVGRLEWSVEKHRAPWWPKWVAEAEGGSVKPAAPEKTSKKRSLHLQQGLMGSSDVPESQSEATLASSEQALNSPEQALAPVDIPSSPSASVANEWKTLPDEIDDPAFSRQSPREPHSSEEIDRISTKLPSVGARSSDGDDGDLLRREVYPARSPGSGGEHTAGQEPLSPPASETDNRASLASESRAQHTSVVGEQPLAGEELSSGQASVVGEPITAGQGGLQKRATLRSVSSQQSDTEEPSQRAAPFVVTANEASDHQRRSSRLPEHAGQEYVHDNSLSYAGYSALLDEEEGESGPSDGASSEHSDALSRPGGLQSDLPSRLSTQKNLLDLIPDDDEGMWREMQQGPQTFPSSEVAPQDSDDHTSPLHELSRAADPRDSMSSFGEPNGPVRRWIHKTVNSPDIMKRRSQLTQENIRDEPELDQEEEEDLGVPPQDEVKEVIGLWAESAVRGGMSQLGRHLSAPGEAATFDAERQKRNVQLLSPIALDQAGGFQGAPPVLGDLGGHQTSSSQNLSEFGERDNSELDTRSSPRQGRERDSMQSSSTENSGLGDFERALELLSPVMQHSPNFGHVTTPNGSRMLTSRESLAAAKSLSTSVTPSPRWLAKNRSPLSQDQAHSPSRSSDHRASPMNSPGNTSSLAANFRFPPERVTGAVLQTGHVASMHATPIKFDEMHSSTTDSPLKGKQSGYSEADRRSSLGGDDNGYDENARSSSSWAGDSVSGYPTRSSSLADSANSRGVLHKYIDDQPSMAPSGSAMTLEAGSDEESEAEEEHKAGSETDRQSEAHQPESPPPIMQQSPLEAESAQWEGTSSSGEGPDDTFHPKSAPLAQDAITRQRSSEDETAQPAFGLVEHEALADIPRDWSDGAHEQDSDRLQVLTPALYGGDLSDEGSTDPRQAVQSTQTPDRSPSNLPAEEDEDCRSLEAPPSPSSVISDGNGPAPSVVRLIRGQSFSELSIAPSSTAQTPNLAEPNESQLGLGADTADSDSPVSPLNPTFRRAPSIDDVEPEVSGMGHEVYDASSEGGSLSHDESRLSRDSGDVRRRSTARGSGFMGDLHLPNGSQPLTPTFYFDQQSGESRPNSYRFGKSQNSTPIRLASAEAPSPQSSRGLNGSSPRSAAGRDSRPILHESPSQASQFWTSRRTSLESPQFGANAPHSNRESGASHLTKSSAAESGDMSGDVDDILLSIAKFNETANGGTSQVGSSASAPRQPARPQRAATLPIPRDEQDPEVMTTMQAVRQAMAGREAIHPEVFQTVPPQLVATQSLQSIPSSGAAPIRRASASSLRAGSLLSRRKGVVDTEGAMSRLHLNPTGRFGPLPPSPSFSHGPPSSTTSASTTFKGEHDQQQPHQPHQPHRAREALSPLSVNAEWSTRPISGRMGSKQGILREGESEPESTPSESASAYPENDD